MHLVAGMRFSSPYECKPSTGFVYTLRDPMFDEIRYVGSSNKPVERYKQHLHTQWATEMRSTVGWPHLVIEGEYPIDQLSVEENRLIEKCREAGCKLENRAKAKQSDYGYRGQAQTVRFFYCDHCGVLIKRGGVRFVYRKKVRSEVCSKCHRIHKTRKAS